MPSKGRMAQNEVQNKITDFLQKNKNYVIAGIVVVLAIVYFSTRGSNGQSQEETSTPPPPPSQSQQNPPPGGPPPAQGNNAPASQGGNSGQNAEADGQTTTGNVTATGKLMASDNAAKGNLMVQSNRGKIYISTKRDFSGMIGKDVTLNAEGTIDSFKFLGFSEAAQKPAEATPPTASTEGMVHFTGTLGKSDNSAKGNYVITSGTQKVYLQSKRDYSAWEGQQVHLKASGTIQSFTNASLTK